MDRCVLLLIVTLVGDPSVAVGQSTISIALKQNTTGEAETRDQLQRLLKTYDMSPWFYTKSVVIDERATPFSHPVLTLHTRHAKDDELLLSTFVHEQLHWFFSGRPEQTEQAIADLRKAFPDAPAGGTAGARDQYSTYLHLLVCFLERQGVSRVLGELKAKQVIEFWATDHYGSCSLRANELRILVARSRDKIPGWTKFWHGQCYLECERPLATAPAV